MKTIQLFIYIYIYIDLFSEFYYKTAKDILAPPPQVRTNSSIDLSKTCDYVCACDWEYICNTARNIFSTGSETQLILCKRHTVYNLGE